MPALSSTPDSILHAAIAAMREGGDRLFQALDEVAAPIYVTNADGIITHYNKACIAFAGRTPRVGEDAWCVTWKLYTSGGQPLPHDQCPMAVAIREGRAIRGQGAVAERPDGTRVQFMAYPTPLLDGRRNVIGAVNLLVEVTDREQAQSLWAQASKCRRLAASMTDKKTFAILTAMAAEYEDEALKLDRAR
jgi:PAS domain-containing protein